MLGKITWFLVVLCTIVAARWLDSQFILGYNSINFGMNEQAKQYTKLKELLNNNTDKQWRWWQTLLLSWQEPYELFKMEFTCDSAGLTDLDGYRMHNSFKIFDIIVRENGILLANGIPTPNMPKIGGTFRNGNQIFGVDINRDAIDRKRYWSFEVHHTGCGKIDRRPCYEVTKFVYSNYPDEYGYQTGNRTREGNMEFAEFDLLLVKSKEHCPFFLVRMIDNIFNINMFNAGYM